MRATFSLLSTFVILASSVNSSSEVVVLDSSNYESFFKDNKISMVEYYAPWCGHCKNLEPKYTEAAEKLKESGVKLAKIDCDAHKDICAKKEIQGYPTIKYFNNGAENNYEAAREVQSIVNFMKKQTLPAVSDISLSELGEFADGENVKIYGVFPDNESKESKSFNDVAEKLRQDFSFAKIKSGIYMFNKHNAKHEMYKSDDLSVEAVSKWINTFSLPLIDEISPENYQTYIKSGLPLLYISYVNAEEKNKYSDIVSKFTNIYRGKIAAITIDGTQYEGHLKNLGLEGKSGIVLFENENESKYPFSGEITEASLEKWLEQYSKGELEPFFKSQPIPTENEGPVKVVVNKSFQQIVKDSKKDVLLKVYAPWCGACKRLAPIYEKVAAAFADQSDKLTIAKFDAIDNDLPKNAGFKLTKFPTLILYKANGTQVELENIEMNANTYVKFIVDNTVNKINSVEIPSEEKSPESNDDDSKEEL